MSQHCTVLTASRSSGIGDGLTYESNNPDLKEGAHVLVPLRKSIIEGIVLSVTKERQNTDYNIKEVHSVLRSDPLLTSAQIKTLQWMAQHYFCTLRQALRVWLPTPPWKDLGPRTEVGYRLIKPDEALRGKKQRIVCEELSGKDWVEKGVLQRATGASTATLKCLKEKNIIAEETRQESAESPPPLDPETISEPRLTAAQREVCTAIFEEKRPSLLFGITGSGKTEVYAQLIANTVRLKKQAILLVPEILLTEHCIHRFQGLLGSEHVAVVHSRLTPSQRRATWRRIHRGEVSLVIGSRSALFAPLPNLGLVIIDEEHEWTYKNEQTPRYHARETAEELCRNAGAKLVMGTATPSLESWARAKSGQYQLLRLPERYGKQPLPNVRVIDLATVKFGSLYPFSPPLLAAIEQRLKKGEQSVLFLNHRGVASALMCLDCRRRIVSPDSNLPFTLHKNPSGKPYLLDHTSGMQADVPVQCPNCGSARLHAIGAGTQRIEEILSKRFEQARLLRADSDTLTHPEHMRLLLKKMREGQADILLGTQSVVKGLDLPNVTLAAVLIADIGLSLPHFRAGERIFQLLTQLTGRSGRAKPGDVIIQTFRPQAPEMLLAAQHKTEEFMEQEFKLRLHSGYPPATKLIRLILRKNAYQRAKELHRQAIAEAEKNDLGITVSSAPLLFGGGKSWHVLLRGANPAILLQYLDLTDAVVDVDPVECV